MERSQTVITLTFARQQSVQVTSPVTADIWKNLVASDPEALAFQTQDWMQALVATGAYQDASRLYEFNNGRRLLLPLVQRAGLPVHLTTAGSMPSSWGMGGLVSAGGPPQADEVSAVFEDLRHLPMLRTSIRPNPVFARVWEQARPANVMSNPMLAHVLDLSGGFEKVWSNRFTGETRTAVRKAERSGLEITLDQTGKDIPVFYELFLRSVDRWAEQQHEPNWLARWRASRRDPIEKLQAIAQATGDAFHLWTAWKDGQPAASILVVQGQNASYTRGAMDKDLAGPTRANQLLHRHAIEAACQSGSRWYHMGESGTSSSLAQFKSRFGAEPVTYAEYFIERVPLTTIDRQMRKVVKKVIGFKDAE